MFTSKQKYSWRYSLLVLFLFLIMLIFARITNHVERSAIGFVIHGLHLDYFGTIGIGFLLLYSINRFRLETLLSPRFESIGFIVCILFFFLILFSRDFSLYYKSTSTDANVIALVAPQTWLIFSLIFLVIYGFYRDYLSAEISKATEIAALGLLVLLTIWMSSYLLINDAHIYNANPLNFGAFAYPIAQVMNGKALLIDFTNQYGYYAHLLEPFLVILGELTVFKISALNCLLFLISGISMIFVIRILTDSWILTLLTYSALIFCHLFIGHLWPYELYYQYFPLRVFFPATTLALTSFYYVKKIKTIRKFLPLWAGLASIWNPDSGAAVCLAVIVFRLIEDVAEDSISPHRGAKRGKVFIQSIIKTVTGITAVWIIFLSYLALRYGELPHLDWILSFQRALTLNTGELSFNLQGPWLIVFLLYFCLIAYVAKHIFREKISIDWRSKLLLTLSVLGLGLLTYNAARELPTAHTTGIVSWPLIMGLSSFLSKSRAYGTSHMLFFDKAKIVFFPTTLVIFLVYLSANMLQTLRLNQILYYHASYFNLVTNIGHDGKTLYYGGKTPVTFGDYKKGEVLFPWVERVEFISKSLSTAQPDDLLILSPFDFYIAMKTKTGSHARHMNFCHIKENDIDFLLDQLSRDVYKTVFIDDNKLIYDHCGWYRQERMKRIVSYIEKNFRLVNSATIDQETITVRLFQLAR
jgi:hypothetical protein